MIAGLRLEGRSHISRGTMMILSRKHGFLFIKAHKVGGTSVEMALSTICGEDDIVTPLTPVDELARLKMGGRPRNYANRPDKERTFLDEIAAASSGELAEIEAKGQRFRNHMTLTAVAKKIDIQGLRVLGIVRSPYALVVSWANHRIGFAEYRRTGQRMKAKPAKIQKVIDRGLREDSLKDKVLAGSYRRPDGQVRIETLRHEHLAEDFDRLIQSLGIEQKVSLPHAKQGLSNTARQCFDMLRPDQRERIAEIFAEDITLFGHQLD